MVNRWLRTFVLSSQCAPNYTETQKELKRPTNHSKVTLGDRPQSELKLTRKQKRFLRRARICLAESQASQWLWKCGQSWTLRWQSGTDENWVHAQGVVLQHSIPGRVLRRFWEGFWGRVLRRGPATGCTVKKGSEQGSLRLRRGSENRVSRRRLQRPLGEYAPWHAPWRTLWENWHFGLEVL